MGSSGDPSPWTALGCFVGIKACLEEVFGSGDFTGRTVALQGCGHVGMFLAARVAVTSLRRLTALLVILTGGATIVAGYAIVQKASIDPVWGRRIEYERAFASIGQPNALAAYLVSSALTTSMMMMGWWVRTKGA